MARSTQTWLDRKPLTRTSRSAPRESSGLRALYDRAVDYLSHPWRTAKAAEARRAARCVAANEPVITASHEAQSAADALAVPAFIESPQSLSADLFAPSRHPETEPSNTHTFNGPNRIEPGEKSDMIMAAARRLAREDQDGHRGVPSNTWRASNDSEREPERDHRSRADRKRVAR